MRTHSELQQSHPRQSHTANEHIDADVIILDWNRPDDTIAAIRSTLNQTGVRLKVWVVDQGSEPTNRQKLASFCDGEENVHVCWLQRNVGVAAGRNIATRLGNAPFVIGLDNDAVFEDPECIARALDRLREQPRLGGVAFRILDADTLSESQYWDYPTAYLGTGIESFEVTRFLGGGHALRRDAFESAGSYDESLFFGGEERDIAWRMLRQGYKLRWYRDLTVHHRTTRASKIDWSDRRYYYLVRNSLYINHKFGAGAFGFARGAASFLLRGLRNGLGAAAIRGIGASCAMSVRFSLDHDEKQHYELTPELRRYIADTDHKTHESSFQKLRRQLTPLPKV